MEDICWFSSPFSGIFFQCECGVLGQCGAGCFRPLSRGLFFNAEIDALNAKMDAIMFSSPFSGTFFQSSDGLLPSNRLLACVFVPFLGDFLSMVSKRLACTAISCFRPLSWGLSFNIAVDSAVDMASYLFSSPFLGTFFQYHYTGYHARLHVQVFVPFLGDFLSITEQVEEQPMYR